MLKFQSSLKAACMAVAALTALGCSQDDLTSQSTLEGNTTIVASFEGAGAGTRTSVNESNQVVWNQNDAFGLFYTTAAQTTPAAAEFKCADADGTTTSASFKGTLEGEVSTSYAVYPYDKDNMSLSDKTVTMKLPAEFAYTKASNGPMYAPASDISKSLGFKHLAGLLKLTVNKGISADAKKFVITADKNIAGTCTADLGTTDPTLAVSTDGSKTITVDLTITDNGSGNITTFYIPIPVATYTTLSAKLVDTNGTELYSPKEWTNITVARAGMLTASFGYVKIDASTEGGIKDAIVAALPESAPATETTTNLQISGTLDATTSSGVSSIEIPVFQNSNVSLALETLPTTSEDKPLVLKDNSTSVTTPTTAVNTMTVAIPKVESNQTAPNFTITMPQTTVELAATGTEGTTYGKITAKTAIGTLVIKQGVTVKNLVVEGGNIRVAGKIEAIAKDAALSGTVYLIKETGATLPQTTTGFEVIDAAAYDIKMALANGKNFVLTADADITGVTITIPKDKTATLDLNGHTITADNSSDGRITVYGNFTLKDSKGNGKITANKDYTSSCSGGVILISGESAHMTMESGYINAVRENAADKGQFAVVLGDGGDFTMTGGKIEAGWYAVSGNGLNKTQNSVIEIKGGELISTADYAVYLPQSGETTISGGKVNGAAGGVAMQRGTLNISGNAQIFSTDEGNTGSQWPDGTGNLGNAALIINAKYGDCEVNITDGTISSLKNAALIENNTGASFARTINISGGTFSDPSVLAYLAKSANVKIKLTSDKTAKGFKTQDGQTVEIDLDTHTLTLADPAVGSTGTETNSCQLLKGSVVTFKNGKVQSENDKIMIQNYSTLLLQDVTVEATKADYVVSNNNGSCTINNSTITAGSGKHAFDVFSFSTYPSVTVTVNASSTINGDVEFGGDNNKKNGKLVINGGTFNGNLSVTEAYYDSENPNIIINGGSFGEYTGWSTYQPKKN